MKKNYMYLVIVFVGVLAACSKSTGTKPGNTAPDFSLKDIQSEGQSLAKYKGKVVMLHFWTDFCKSCRAEFPIMQDFYAELKSEDFELLAINIKQPLFISKDFHKSFQTTFPMLADLKGITQSLYKIEAFPTNFFINPEGKIIRKITGWVDKTQVEVIINQNKLKNKKTRLSKH